MHGVVGRVAFGLRPALLLLVAGSVGGCQWVEENVAPIAGGVIGAGAGYGVGKALGLSDKEAAAVAVVGAGVGVVAGILIKQANERERDRAELEAVKAKQRMQEAELQQLKAKNAKLACKANDEGDVMIVDPDTGKTVDDNVYKPTPEGQSEGYGKLGDHTVVFVG